ncbi:ParB/RepB/Spo0J family partition protein [Gloeothece verrucosa]|uniref:ParB-like partition protein n=1 Tax=Gloeothece verrucosa (strain PCC 7822) TaxID=497965 RepID=E0UNV8_GLOV7|nr:ParB/RepB/Spo0J family partition protein [Gloeothece verrucosa]ADN18638.1 parB-like partition protein [Gloeothece verrucosa PCC 7822]
MARRKNNQPLKSEITAPWAESLAPTTSTPDSTIPITEIHLNKQQPRRYFDPQALEELIKSISQHGILQPLLVRPLEDGGYELVAGERRYRAATEVGLTEVPVVIRELSNEQALQLALIENLQREDLNPVEETEGILQLLSLRLNITFEEAPSVLYRLQNEAKGKVTRNEEDSELEEQIVAVFDSIGIMNWESFVRNRLPLLNLPEDIKTALREGLIAYTKAVAIARIKDEATRRQILTEAIEKKLSLSEIKERILFQSSQQESPSNSDSLPQRLKSAYQLLKKSRIWDKPEKREQLEQLLAQLEVLAKDDELSEKSEEESSVVKES